MKNANTLSKKVFFLLPPTHYFSVKCLKFSINLFHLLDNPILFFFGGRRDLGGQGASILPFLCGWLDGRSSKIAGYYMFFLGAVTEEAAGGCLLLMG